LNYINNYTDIGISFRPFYNFTDTDNFRFCIDPSKKKIVPINNENERAFLYGIKQTGGGEDVRSFCVILNASGRAIWFTDPTNTIKLEDDHKLLLASLILTASNKRNLEFPYFNLRIGYLTPYLNVINKDMFEVYKFSLGLGYPY
jgi:arabinogalactan endo-1,4-beta-galactosidase